MVGMSWFVKLLLNVWVWVDYRVLGLSGLFNYEFVRVWVSLGMILFDFIMKFILRNNNVD